MFRLVPLLVALPVVVAAPLLPMAGVVPPVTAQPEIESASRDRIGQLIETGRQLQHQGHPQAALERYQQALAIHRQVKSQPREGATLASLGATYLRSLQTQADRWAAAGDKALRQRHLDDALQAWQNATTLYQQLGNHPAEAATLQKIGEAHYHQNAYPEALDAYHQALAIWQAQQQTQQIGETLNSLGDVYREQGRYAQALKVYHQALAIAQALVQSGKARSMESQILDDIGSVYIARGQYAQALSFYQQALAIAQAIGDRARQSDILEHLGAVHHNVGQYAKAIELAQQSLGLAREIDSPEQALQVLNLLGFIYARLEQYPKALSVRNQALTLAQQLNDRVAEGFSLNNLGDLYVDLGQYPTALSYYQRSLAIFEDGHFLMGKATSLKGIGKVYDYLGQPAKALEVYQQALSLTWWTNARPGILTAIGKAYLRSGRPQAAEKHLSEAATILESMRPGLADANKVSLLETQSQTYDFWQQALVAQNKFGKALEVAERDRARAFVELLHQRLQVSADEPAELQAQADRWLSQGDNAFQNQQFETALRAWQQALSHYQQLGDRLAEASTLWRLGKGHRALNHSQISLEYYWQALAIHEQLADPQGAGNVLNSIGVVYDELGQTVEALDSYQQALAKHRDAQNRREEGNTLNNLGWLHYSQDRYAKALDAFQQAFAIAEAADDPTIEATTLSGLGWVHYALGQETKAFVYFQQNLEIARATRNRSQEGTILDRLGMVHRVLRQYPEALASYQQALEIAREIEDRSTEASALMGMGLVRTNLGQYEKALAHYQQALDIYQQLGSRSGEGTVLTLLGVVRHKLGQYADSLNLYRQALAIHQALNDRPMIGTDLNNMGAAYLQSDRPQMAEKALFKALAALESLFPGLNDEHKVSLFETQTMTYRLLQEALVAQNKVGKALEVAERGRARAFVELLHQRTRPLASLLSQATPSPDSAPETTIQPITLAEIKQVAKHQNATLVEYSIIREEAVINQRRIWQDSQLFIWVVALTGEIAFRQVSLLPTADAPARSRPAVSDFSQLVGQTRSSLRGGLGITANSNPTASPSQNPLAFQTALPAEQLRQRLRQLHQKLIAPIADLLPADPQQRVIFIPQGALFWVPFPALLDDEGQYLIEQHTISTAPSIQVLAQTHQRRQQLPTTGEVLIVGNPIMPSYGDPPQPLPPLPGSQQEAETLAQFFQVPALVRDRATEAAVKQRIQQARLIHLATHGILDDRQALNSALALTPTDNEDGFLSAAELFDLTLQAELVVLSACDTGKGKITGDGVIGLSRSLIAAGVPSTIVSLWAIPDAPTAELMGAFYQNRAAGMDKAQALRQAMLATKAKHPHPLNWAAFTLIGEVD